MPAFKGAYVAARTRATIIPTAWPDFYLQGKHMTDSRGVLREVAWREVFPWLLIFRCFRLAIHPTILTIALAAALLTPLGWRAAQWIVFQRSIPAEEEL